MHGPIRALISSGTPDDVPSFWSPDPLFDEPPLGPSWYDPATWIPWTNWDGSFEIGINGSEGNGQVISWQTGFDLSRETPRTDWNIFLNYNRTQSDGRETQHNALFTSKWDWKLHRPRWTVFNKLGLDYDEFQNFDIRVFLDSGMGYVLIDTERTNLKGRFGAGANREFGGPQDFWKPDANLGGDLEHQLTELQKLLATVDYYPTWKDFSDYRVISDVSWQIVLDKDADLSLKISLVDRYDSTPNGAEPHDLNYGLVLLWSI